MTSAHATTDHQEIRRWAAKPGPPGEGRDRRPGRHIGLDFGEKDPNLTGSPGDEFFRIFDDTDLALLIQAEPSESEGHESRFNKFVQRPNDRKPSREHRH